MFVLSFADEDGLMSLLFFPRDMSRGRGLWLCRAIETRHDRVASFEDHVILLFLARMSRREDVQDVPCQETDT